MGQLADDAVNGFMCSGCGVCFAKPHGYPVLCHHCWDHTDEKDRAGCQRATNKEL